jgi:hypothetical protein
MKTLTLINTFRIAQNKTTHSTSIDSLSFFSGRQTLSFSHSKNMPKILKIRDLGGKKVAIFFSSSDGRETLSREVIRLKKVQLIDKNLISGGKSSNP